MNTATQLSTIIAALPRCVVHGPGDRTIAALRYDSRLVGPGDVFFAWKGQNADGHRFVGDVVSRGAVAVVVEDAAAIPSSLSGEDPTYLLVADARRALAIAGAAFYGRPDRSMRMIGVTGTNGKTTTTFLIKHLLQSAGRKVGLIGTVGHEIGAERFEAKRTTPEGLDLHELLARMREAGCDDVVMEVSSHALDQGRVAPIAYQVGVFTNLTQDHLDYHGDMDRYFAAKRVLFTNLRRDADSGADTTVPAGVAVVNLDDARGASLYEEFNSGLQVIAFTIEDRANAALSAHEISYSTLGTEALLHFDHDASGFELTMPLLGAFNASNALAAAATALALGLDREVIVQALAVAPPVPGRLERVPSTNGVTVVVDYAHTDDAIIKALRALREVTKGRLIIVVGCGGNRDAAKRPRMAKAAVEDADHAIFTADNPRRESIETILDHMVAGVPAAKNYSRIADRRAAIAAALEMAKPGDVVCIAGKGHETTQEINGEYFPFDDRLVAAELLAHRGGI